MGLSVDQILASLESEKTAEDIFATNLVVEPAEKLAQEEPEETPEVETEETPEETEVEDVKEEVEEPEEVKEPEEVEEPEEKEAAAKCAPSPKKKVKEEVTEKVAESEDFQKLAEDLDAQGRIMAHGFFDELVKLSEVEVPEQEEKTAEASAEDEGTQILINLYNRYHGGNN